MLTGARPEQSHWCCWRLKKQLLCPAAVVCCPWALPLTQCNLVAGCWIKLSPWMLLPISIQCPTTSWSAEYELYNLRVLTAKLNTHTIMCMQSTWVHEETGFYWCFTSTEALWICIRSYLHDLIQTCTIKLLWSPCMLWSHAYSVILQVVGIVVLRDKLQRCVFTWLILNYTCYHHAVTGLCCLNSIHEFHPTCLCINTFCTCSTLYLLNF